MKTALITIATGASYRNYAKAMFRSAIKFFPLHDPYVYTDEPSAFLQEGAFFTEAKGYPRETLMRYHTMLEHIDLWESYDQIFYIDADMLFVAPVGTEIFSEGLTATLHPGYVGTRGTPETNPNSYAYCSHNTAYYCGGFQGGSALHYLNMADQLAMDIGLDERRGMMAVWHDESHWNRYLADHLPAKVLDPSYCYPENAGAHYLDKWAAAGISPTPKIVALTKGDR